MAWQADYYERLREKSEREDMLMFINSCFAATGQNEYYSDRYTDSVSIGFLHQYILANYRAVYARALSAGINHFSQALIIRNLLKHGAPLDHDRRLEEGRLIAATLRLLPAHRVFKLFKQLRLDSINNRRTRAVVRDYLAFQKFNSYHSVKYRHKLRIAVRHAHVAVDHDTAKFLFSFKETKQFVDPLYDTYRRAHYSQQAVFELPFTIAEGLAARHGIRHEDFLRKIEPMMTRTEKLRLQNAASRARHVAIDIDLSNTPLTRLALYVLAMPLNEREQRAEELHTAFKNAAQRLVRVSSLHSLKSAAVLDRSRSTWGSRERRRLPLAISVAMHYLLSAVSGDFRSFWSPTHGDSSGQFGPNDHMFLVEPGGQTDLATPLLDAIAWSPDEIVVVSDGYENSPPGGVNQIVHAYRQRLQSQRPIVFMHVNPVFDAEHFSPKRLGDALVTLGLREVEDFPASLRFAKYAAGEATQSQLENFLYCLAEQYIEQTFARQPT